MRERLGLGRLLPLGEPRDGAWIAEDAAREILLAAARGVPGVRPGGLRIAPADPGEAPEPAVLPPPSALPPGPLRVTADFAVAVGPAVAAEPLPEVAARVRAALSAASRGIGMAVTRVDLRATDVLDAATASEPALGGEPRARPAAAAEVVAAEAGDGDAGRVAAAALAVAGVTRLTAVLGRPVDLTRPPQEAALPRRHVRVELAVARDHRAVEVARRVRAAVTDCLPDHPSVAVLVTALD